MKKLGAFLIVLCLILGAAFMWLLSKSGPEHANTEIITKPVDDNFER